MKALLATLACCTALATPALAVSPTPGKDPTQCTVKYDPSETLDLRVPAGDQVTVIFGDAERIDLGSGNNDASQGGNGLFLPLKAAKGQNFLPIKTVGTAWQLPPFQVFVRTVADDPDIKPHDYSIRYTSLPPNNPVPPGGAKTVQLAAAGEAGLTDATRPAPEPAPSCLVVRYLHPADEAAAKAKKAQGAWLAARRIRAEQQLRAEQIGTALNFEYDFQGDRSIGPNGNPGGVTTADRADIYDDGNTTVLHFPGNQRVPVFYEPDDKGADGKVINTVAETNGTIKLTGVFPVIHLRMDTDKVLCIFNRHVTDHNPQTGTASPNISREIRR